MMEKLFKLPFIALILSLLLACKGSESGITGTYVNSAGSEFSIANDTLVVEHEQGKRYLLHRSTGFRLLDEDGKPGRLQHEKEQWTAVMDSESGMMTEDRKGKQISFDAASGTMSVGKRRYKRIN